MDNLQTLSPFQVICFGRSFCSCFCQGISSLKIQASHISTKDMLSLLQEVHFSDHISLTFNHRNLPRRRGSAPIQLLPRPRSRLHSKAAITSKKKTPGAKHCTSFFKCRLSIHKSDSIALHTSFELPGSGNIAGLKGFAILHTHSHVLDTHLMDCTHNILNDHPHMPTASPRKNRIEQQVRRLQDQQLMPMMLWPGAAWTRVPGMFSYLASTRLWGCKAWKQRNRVEPPSLCQSNVANSRPLEKRPVFHKMKCT